jgi:DNA polymerase I-like protein with 3'-5' exonuclease and polymerase domains
MTDWSLALRIEHEVARIITQQEINGVMFDIPLADKHLAFLEQEMDRLYDEVRPLLKMEVINQHEKKWKTVKRPFLKSNGKPSASSTKYLGDVVDVLGGCFTPVAFAEPDLGKRQKLIDQLLRIGWTPYEYTDKGNPKITEESLEVLEGDVGKAIARWYILKHRHSQIKGWRSDPRLLVDGRLTASAITCGTNTGRMRHSRVVNVPKASDKVVFGHEMRSLFTVPYGKVMVGHDASGLELRMLAHYMGDPEYTDLILHGDVHTYNMQAAGLTDRDQAKTFIYAFLYGAGDAKIGSIVGGGAKDGKRLKAQFLNGLPALKRLKKKVDRLVKKGYLPGLDGRKVYIRSEHSALNALFQSAGAITMKVSMCYLDKWVRRAELDVLNVINMHDEIQSELFEKDVELYSHLAVKSIIKAGEFLNLRCPLDAEAKVGNNWAMTH